MESSCDSKACKYVFALQDGNENVKAKGCLAVARHS